MNPRHLSLNSVLLPAKINEEFNKNAVKAYRTPNLAWDRQKPSRMRECLKGPDRGLLCAKDLEVRKSVAPTGNPSSRILLGYNA